MKITIAAVGRMKEKYYSDMQAEYAKRISRFARLEIREIPEAPESLGAAAIKRECEGLERVASGTRNAIVLTPEGKRLTSEGFSELISGIMASGEPDICFIIGGPNGIAPELKKNALCVSMSDMTFPHRLARIMLLEQLYRAFKIMHGETYHK